MINYFKNIFGKAILVFVIMLGFLHGLKAENGHGLWLRYNKAHNVTVKCNRSSVILNTAKKELQQAWQGKSGATVTFIIRADKAVKGDGYHVINNTITARTEAGILYGVFEVLRRQHLAQPLKDVVSNPSYQLRLLNHWDNLDGSVERGYAGNSIFWRHDRDTVVSNADKSLWAEYARANASIGINGSVLNNVNASPRMLSAENLQKAKAIAAVLRPYGIKVYLSVNFSSPTKLGNIATADPLNVEVIQWWKEKVREIYNEIPDFGGFLVKANSEGQPGPQDFGRTHADGANMLADALKPYGGVVMWRAFVYSSTDKDRARQAYSEFLPLDGKFHPNVILQLKNGPIDFQPREPFSPLFGALKKTPIMPEFQITQEYLGQSVQLVFLASMWQECLQSDTYQYGEGSTIAKCTDGSIHPQTYTAIAGVANTGLDSNWCGHQFAQANWYAFGRLAWSNKLSAATIADEWLKLTFSSATKNAKGTAWKTQFLKPVKKLMLQSREVAVNYMMPLGLHHIFSGFAHYGPGPWYAPAGTRVDWTPPYYHKADTGGIGFDRTITGSNAVSQYHEPLASRFASLNTCPEIYLLWFHHLSWSYKTKSGFTLWDDICYHYQKGVTDVRQFAAIWQAAKPFVDSQRFSEVQNKLHWQARDAQVWKDGCLLYFQQFSRRPFPPGVEPAVYDLKYLEQVDPRTINK
jgi:alpha-glucuronidase